MGTARLLLSSEGLWTIFGATGAIIFFGRFCVQWVASEIQKKSVIPIAFWYMSSVGSLMQFIYAVHLGSPGAAFGQCFNIVVYVRNLVHIWRERGQLTRALNIGIHTAAGLIVSVAAVFTALTWRAEITGTLALNPEEAARNWFWLGVWGAGQGLFFLRFLVQWAATEIKKKSVVPTVFWYFSLAAALLQSAHFFERRDWIFAIAMVATIVIYSRNLMLIYARRRREAMQDEPQ